MSKVCHVEFDCTDLDRSQAFYEALFGWTFQEFMGGQMRVFASEGTHVGGLTLKDKVASGRSPSVWFQVEDIDAVLAKAKAQGAGIIDDKYDLPGVGFSAWITDPDGNPVGLVQYLSSEGA